MLATDPLKIISSPNASKVILALSAKETLVISASEISTFTAKPEDKIVATGVPIETVSPTSTSKRESTPSARARSSVFATSFCALATLARLRLTSARKLATSTSRGLETKVESAASACTNKACADKIVAFAMDFCTSACCLALSKSC